MAGRLENGILILKNSFVHQPTSLLSKEKDKCLRGIVLRLKTKKVAFFMCRRRVWGMGLCWPAWPRGLLRKPRARSALPQVGPELRALHSPWRVMGCRERWSLTLPAAVCFSNPEI